MTEVSEFIRFILVCYSKRKEFEWKMLQSVLLLKFEPSSILSFVSGYANQCFKKL